MEGDLRYLSHQETLRLLSRALARARLPVCHTEGFNPRPRIALPLPRPVGVASRAERAIVDFTEPIDPDCLADQLRAQFPPGMRVQRAVTIGPSDRSAPRMVRYRVTIAQEGRADLSRRAEEMLRFAPIPYDRFVHKTGRIRHIDLRPYLEAIEVDASSVRLTVFVTDGGSVKPAELCEVLGIAERPMNHLIERTEVVWQTSHGEIH